MGYLDMGENYGQYAEKLLYKGPGGQSEVKPRPAATPGARGWPVPLKLAAPGHVAPCGPLVVPH